MVHIKLVTFDVTNTIIKIAGSVGFQYASIAKQYGIIADEQKLTQAFKTQWKEQNRQYPNFGATKGISSYKWWTQVVKETFLKTDFDGSKNNLDQIAGHLYKQFTMAQAWEILPHSQPVLQELNDRGIILGAVSNFDSRLEKVLMNLGLLHHFKFVLSSEKMKFAKPENEIFLEALRLGSVTADQALHIGDSVENDYFGPRSVGMAGVLLVKDMCNIPDHVDKQFCITDLSDVLKFIK